MRNKLVIIPLLLLVMVLALQGCAPGGNPAATPTPAAAADTSTPTATDSTAPAATDTAIPTVTETAPSGLVLTLDQLFLYNGKNGQPAYVAVDGVIYDVTKVPQWKNGDHHGFTAGNDLTVEIKTVSPHGLSKLVGLPVVGTLAN
jgi:predicted heme/steroid binding protein